LAIKCGEGDLNLSSYWENEGRYIMAFPKRRKGKRHLFLSINRAASKGWFYGRADDFDEELADDFR
jgi:hypothetical protein